MDLTRYTVHIYRSKPWIFRSKSSIFYVNRGYLPWNPRFSAVLYYFLMEEWNLLEVKQRIAFFCSNNISLSSTPQSNKPYKSFDLFWIYKLKSFYIDVFGNFFSGNKRPRGNIQDDCACEALIQKASCLIFTSIITSTLIYY